MGRSREGYSKRTLQSVDISFNIIELLQEHDRPSLTEITEELGHSKSTVYSHLQTLEDQKMIVHEHGGYRLSLRVLDMANQAQKQTKNDQFTHQGFPESGGIPPADDSQKA